MEIYIKASQEIQSHKLDLLLKHIEKSMMNHPDVDSIKLSIKQIEKEQINHRIRAVIKINGHNVLCMVVGSDIYNTISKLIDKVERSLRHFYQGQNSDIAAVSVVQAA